MTLPEKITAARRAIGLTQEELASRARVTVRTIQRIENGQSFPRMHTMRTIADALGMPYSEINPVQQPEEESTQQGTNSVTAGADPSATHHFLHLVCLSCFSYLVIPYVHFLVPRYLTKREKQLSDPVLSFARKIVRVQIWWVVLFNMALLMTVFLNFALIHYGALPINYLWIVFIAYIANLVIISRYFFRIKAIVA